MFGKSSSREKDRETEIRQKRTTDRTNVQQSNHPEAERIDVLSLVDKSRARAVSEILTTRTEEQTDKTIGRGEAGTRARDAAQLRRERGTVAQCTKEAHKDCAICQ